MTSVLLGLSMFMAASALAGTDEDRGLLGNIDASVVVAGASVAGPSVVRAADDERPHRRSRDLEHGQPRVQMGAGPTAVAMLAFVAAVVARSVRRRRSAAVAE